MYELRLVQLLVVDPCYMICFFGKKMMFRCYKYVLKHEGKICESSHRFDWFKYVSFIRTKKNDYNNLNCFSLKNGTNNTAQYSAY